MKIGYFTTKFPYSQSYQEYQYGGSTLAAYYLALEMAKRGHDIKIFTTSKDSYDSIEQKKNMTVLRYGTTFRMLTTNISVGSINKSLRHEVDIAHVHFDIPPGPLVGLLYATRKKLPLIVSYHGDWVESYGGILRKLGVAFNNKFLVNKLLGRANIIISPSKNYIKESRFLKNYENKTIVIPNGLNLIDYDISYTKEQCRKKLELPINKKIILFLGYLVSHKGPEILVMAMQQILKEIPQTNLIFLGDGALKDDLEHLTERLALKKNIQFKGFKDGFEKALYYKCADVFVLPSLYDCFPLVILEAMAYGIPVIASNIGGIPDAIKDGENGLLVPPGNPIDLADAICSVLKNETLSKNMGIDGMEKSYDYSWEKIAEKTEKIYERICR